MKKLLVLLFSILISFNSYGFFHKTVCLLTDTQERHGLYYLPNNSKPFSGNNFCEYENGQHKSKGKVKDGLREGKWTWWHENGQLYTIMNMDNGTVGIGKLIAYHSNGKKSEEGTRTKDGIHGKYTRWKENGEIYSEAIYKDGKCISGDCD